MWEFPSSLLYSNEGDVCFQNKGHFSNMTSLYNNIAQAAILKTCVNEGIYVYNTHFLAVALWYYLYFIFTHMTKCNAHSCSTVMHTISSEILYKLFYSWVHKEEIITELKLLAHTVIYSISFICGSKLKRNKQFNQTTEKCLVIYSVYSIY